MTNMKVIFIAGADFSGSTMLGAILASSPDEHISIFHIGEAHAYFNDRNNKYGKVVSSSEIWNKIPPNIGYTNAYNFIFSMLKVNTIIDSSKNLDYLSSQHKESIKNGYEFITLIPYRPFPKIYKSAIKRHGSTHKAEKNILKYIEILNYIVENDIRYKVVSIAQLITEPTGTTKDLCLFSGIPYFSGKEEYWNFKQHHIHGNKKQGVELTTGKLLKFDKSWLQEDEDTIQTHSFFSQPDIINLEKRLNTLAYN